MYVRIRGEAEVLVERRNIVGKENGRRGASSRGFVPRIRQFCGRPNTGVRYENVANPTQATGTPPLHNVGFRKIIVETLNSVGHPTRCPQPLNSVRQKVSYIVQCLRNDFLKPT